MVIVMRGRGWGRGWEGDADHFRSGVSVSVIKDGSFRVGRSSRLRI